MKLKTLVLVVAILAALSLVAYYLQRPPAPTGIDPRTKQPVLEAKTLEKTSKIRLSDQGKTVVLTRQPDGKWIVPSYYDIPADFSKLSRFIDDLVGGKIQRLVTQNPERLARLEFKDTSVALLGSADQVVWNLTLGKDAEGGGRFVRFGDEKKGYLASLNLYIDATAKNWADTLLVDLKPDDIAEVVLTCGEGAPVTATRSKKGDAWATDKAPAGQRIKGDRITSLLSSFTSLRFQDTSDPNDANVEAARKNSRTVALTTFDHKSIKIEIGRKPEEKKLIEVPKADVRGTNASAADQKPALANEGSTALSGEPAAATPVAPASVKPAPAVPAKPEEPKTETIPAGPVYVFITSSDAGATINALMAKRAFQVFESNFTGLPQKRDELFEPIPPPPPAEKKPEAGPAPVPPTPAATPQPAAAK
jgi:Domain of unknown function (DUF4340)